MYISKDGVIEVSGSPTEKAILQWGVKVLSCQALASIVEIQSLTSDHLVYPFFSAGIEV